MLVGSPPSSRRSQQQPSLILSPSSSEQLAGFTPTATLLLRMGPTHRRNNGGAALSSRTSLPTTTTTTQYQQQLQQQYHRSPPKHSDSSSMRRDTKRFHNVEEDDHDGTRSVVPQQQQQQQTALLRSHDETERDVEASHIGLSVVELTSPERRSPSDRHNRNEDDADDVPRHSSSSSLSPLSQASMDDPSTAGRDGSHSPFGSPTKEQRADRQRPASVFVTPPRPHQPPQRPPTAPKYTPVRAASAGGTSSPLSTDSDSKRTTGTKSALSPQAHHHHHSDDEERHSPSPMEYFSASRRPAPVAAMEDDGASSGHHSSLPLNEDAEVLLAKMAYRQYMQHAEKSLRKLYEAVDTIPVEEELQNEEGGTRGELTARDSRGDDDGSIVTVDMSFSSDPLPQSHTSRSSGPATREELLPPLPSSHDPPADRGSGRMGRQQRGDAPLPLPPPPPQEVKRQEALGEFRAPNRSRVVVVGASSKTSTPTAIVGAEATEEETKVTIFSTSTEARADGNGEVPSMVPPAPPRQLWVFGEDEDFPAAVRHIPTATTTVSVANKTTTAPSRPTPQLTMTAASAIPERQTLAWPNSDAPKAPSDKTDEERQANDDRHHASSETGEGQIRCDPNMQQQSEEEEEMFFAAVRHAQPLAPWQRVLSVAPHKASVDEHATPRQDDAISIVRTPLAKSRVLRRNPILSLRPPPPFPSSSLALSQNTKKSESGATTAAMRERSGDEDEPSDALESSSGTVVVVATTSASASPQTSPTTSPSVAVPRDHHHFENGPLFLPDSNQQHNNNNNHNVTAAVPQQGSSSSSNYIISSGAIPSQPLLLRPESPPPPSIVVEKPSPTPSASQARFIALMSGSKVPPPPPPLARHSAIMEQFPSYVDPSPVSPSASTLRGVEDGAISPSVRSTSTSSSIQFEEAAAEDAHPTDDDAIAVVLTEVENVVALESSSLSSSSSVMFHEEVDHEDDKAANVATTLPPPNSSAPPSPPLLSPSSTWQPITTSGEYSPSRQKTTTRATTTTAGIEAVPPLPPPPVVKSAGFSLLQAAVERTTQQRSAPPPRFHPAAASASSPLEFKPNAGASERASNGGDGTLLFPAQDRGTTDSPQFFEESANDAIDPASRSVGAEAVSRVRSATMLLHAQQTQLSVMERISDRGSDDDDDREDEEEGEIRTEDVRWTSSDDSGASSD